MIKYKNNEKALLTEIQSYVDKTYEGHYSGKGGVQANDLIESTGLSMGFYLGNIFKYGARYGKKKGANRADLIKIIHYGLLALNEHDRSLNEDK
jgi:hypothetical protein